MTDDGFKEWSSGQAYYEYQRSWIDMVLTELKKDSGIMYSETRKIMEFDLYDLYRFIVLEKLREGIIRSNFTTKRYFSEVKALVDKEMKHYHILPPPAVQEKESERDSIPTKDEPKSIVDEKNYDIDLTRCENVLSWIAEDVTKALELILVQNEDWKESGHIAGATCCNILDLLCLNVLEIHNQGSELNSAIVMQLLMKHVKLMFDNHRGLFKKNANVWMARSILIGILFKEAAPSRKLLPDGWIKKK